MPTTVARLRTAILGTAVLLVAVLAAYFALSRWKDRFLRHDLPGRLGINIQQDSSGFTLSKSAHGKTLYTIHASRAVQLKGNGDAELHDVRIVMYGQGDVPRQDSIRGDEFHYDKQSQVVSSEGDVQIDMQSLNAGQQEANANAGSIQVKTHGLTFDQKSGTATTANMVEFALPQMRGTAVGAEYQAEQGIVILQSQVAMHTQLDGGDATITASHAAMDRAALQVTLDNAALHSAKRDAAAQRATVWLRADGSADHMMAEGDATMTTADGTTLRAPLVQATFDTDSQMQAMHAEGGVAMHQAAAPQRPILRDVQAQQAWLQMGTDDRAKHLRLLGAVRLTQHRAAQAGTGKPTDTLQTLTGGEVNVDFRDGDAQRVLASGSPQLAQVQTSVGGHSDKLLQADTLQAELRDGKALQQITGEGHTRFTQRTASGESDASEGDHLVAHFAVGPDSSQQITQAVQQGSVRFERHQPAKLANQPDDVTLAHADRADYEQSAETVLLTGTAQAAPRALPRMVDHNAAQGTTELTAHTITLHRDTGDALAEGQVAATLRGNQPEAEPTHILADQAVLIHAAATATFTGSTRLWQGGNSVQAPTIVLTQQPRGMTASASPDGKQLVHAVLVDSKAARPQPPVRVTAHSLVYSDADRRARFSTGVTLVDADGTVRADQADVFFRPANSNPANGNAATAAVPMPGGQLDRIVATGSVFLTQLQRQAAGQQMVYTASDGRYVLTGTPGRPPHVNDSQSGSVSGDTLQFFTGSKHVDVLGGPTGRAVSTTDLTR